MTVAGVGVTALGAGLTALAFRDYGPESYTGVVYATFGVPTIALGSVATTTGTCIQAARVGAEGTACGLSIGAAALTGVGVAVYVPLVDANASLEPFAWVLAGTAAESFVAAVVQSAVNRSTWRDMAVVPSAAGRPGIAVVGRF